MAFAMVFAMALVTMTLVTMATLLPLAAQAADNSGAAATDARPDPWAPLRPLLGDWAGSSMGKPGAGSVTRRYAWVLGGRYLNESNTSVYPPSEKKPQGERHEHWGMFSLDKARGALMLRQFHVEGFINTYRVVAAASERLVLESEAFENLPSAWRARETYEFAGPDEFVETFELAAPGKDFEVYSRTRLRRTALQVPTK